MNAEHKSRASSLRALKTLLTPRRRKGGHYDCVEGGGGVGRAKRVKREEMEDNGNRFKLQNMQNDKTNASKKKLLLLFFLLLSHSSGYRFLPLSLYCACVTNASAELALTNH